MNFSDTELPAVPRTHSEPVSSTIFWLKVALISNPLAAVLFVFFSSMVKSVEAGMLGHRIMEYGPDDLDFTVLISLLVVFLLILPISMIFDGICLIVKKRGPILYRGMALFGALTSIFLLCLIIPLWADWKLVLAKGSE